MKAIEVFHQSSGEVTTAYYRELEARGPLGHVAMNLFRAQKCSSRAKVYRGGRYRRSAYDRKSWSLDNLVQILQAQAAELGITFGWKQDHAVVFGTEPSWVLYIDLPQGQVSFHSPWKGDGPDYKGDWDGKKDMSVMRILRLCDDVMAMPPEVK